MRAKPKKKTEKKEMKYGKVIAEPKELIGIVKGDSNYGIDRKGKINAR